MARHVFYTDNSAECPSCEGTIAQYTTDDEVSLVDVVCISCNTKDLFSCSPTPQTAAECSAIDRRIRR